MFVKKGFKGEKEIQKEANELRERLNYGKSAMEYIRDYANTLNTNESVRVADIKKLLEQVDRRCMRINAKHEHHKPSADRIHCEQSYQNSLWGISK